MENATPEFKRRPQFCIIVLFFVQPLVSFQKVIVPFSFRLNFVCFETVKQNESIESRRH
jgi:hypothetical protein